MKCGEGLLRCQLGPFQPRWPERLRFVSWDVSSCTLSSPCCNPVWPVGLGILLSEHLWMLEKVEMSDWPFEVFCFSGTKVSIQLMPWINPKGCIFLHWLNKRSLNLTNVSQLACTFTPCSAINMICACKNVNNMLLKSRRLYIPPFFLAFLSCPRNIYTHIPNMFT